MEIERSLKLIDDKTLCLLNDEGKILAKRKPLWTKFKQAKRIKEDCNIVKEDDRGLPQNIGKTNIYCLDDNFNLKWSVEAPLDRDHFPSEIVWNKKSVRTESPLGYLTLDFVDSPNSFICSSLKGVTVTVDYDTGETISAELTK